MTGTDLAIQGKDGLAATFIKSGMFPDTKNEAQAVVKILAGQEYGLAPFASMRGIHIIQGQAVPGAHVLAGRVKSCGRYTFRRVEHTNEKCSLEFFESAPDGWASLGVETFDMADAKRAGLLGKTNWQKYPRNMLFARVIANGVRFHCPDITGGPVLVAEELDDTYVPPGAIAEPIAVVNEAEPPVRPSAEAVAKFFELYETKDLPVPKPEGAPDDFDPHGPLRLLLASVGAGNAGDVHELVAGLGKEQFEKVWTAVAGSDKA